MASTFSPLKPVITHNHHSHVSHSPPSLRSPSRHSFSSHSPSPLKHSRSNGNPPPHTHSLSESHVLSPVNEMPNSPFGQGISPYPPSPQRGSLPTHSPDPFVEQKYEPAPLASYLPPQNQSQPPSHNHHNPQDHSHQHLDHTHHVHGHRLHDHGHHDHGHHAHGSLGHENHVQEKEHEQIQGAHEPHNHNEHDPHSHNHTFDHTHDHVHDHKHVHSPPKATLPGPRSRFTSLVLPFALRWPLIHTILSEKDSRRIFYFMSLNFAFMTIQATYGYLTDSLGLLSDSVHMFFDCLALAVGLFASVASKWPASARFPYGFGKIESLSGFGNAVFLMLISLEIMMEATERLAEARETKRLMELFVVSFLGLAVNLVGMVCFGHAGHDHGGHSHSHSHAEPHSHEAHGHGEHNHDHAEHDCDGHAPFLSEKAPVVAPHSHAGHSHSHDNENMIGIYLHILADTMGSAAVVVSTALTHFTGWNGWDPLASLCIAALIFASSIPLLKSSAKKLLLTIPDDTEYALRDALGALGELRGVGSYSVPTFWFGDMYGGSEQILGVIHVIATRGSDLDDVKDRTRAFLLERGMDVVVQVEKDGDTSCWCGAGGGSGRSGTPSASRFS